MTASVPAPPGYVPSSLIGHHTGRQLLTACSSEPHPWCPFPQRLSQSALQSP
jgi:hypothetical protein